MRPEFAALADRTYKLIVEGLGASEKLLLDWIIVAGPNAEDELRLSSYMLLLEESFKESEVDGLLLWWLYDAHLDALKPSEYPAPVMPCANVSELRDAFYGPEEAEDIEASESPVVGQDQQEIQPEQTAKKKRELTADETKARVLEQHAEGRTARQILGSINGAGGSVGLDAVARIIKEAECVDREWADHEVRGRR